MRVASLEGSVRISCGRWRSRRIFPRQQREDVFRRQRLVIATGGLSIPKMGATGFGYDMAGQFGLSIIECRPALVPFVFDPRIAIGGAI